MEFFQWHFHAASSYNRLTKIECMIGYFPWCCRFKWDTNDCLWNHTLGKEVVCNSGCIGHARNHVHGPIIGAKAIRQSSIVIRCLMYWKPIWEPHLLPWILQKLKPHWWIEIWSWAGRESNLVNPFSAYKYNRLTIRCSRNQCEMVVCCRVSLVQKALMVKLVSGHPHIRAMQVVVVRREGTTFIMRIMLDGNHTRSTLTWIPCALMFLKFE